MLARFDRLIKTFIAKKYIAWLTATILLVQRYISGSEWVAMTTAIFLIDAGTKPNVIRDYKTKPVEQVL